MFDALFAWLLFPLGALLGWSFARRRESGGGSSARADTLAGLGSLARDDDEQAISALSRAAAAEPDTLELQSALGGLFRKRGEIDRAIRLHEAVLARPDLSAAAAAGIRYELAQDFLKSGLMDRAEPLLQELAVQGAWVVPALELLLDLHEQGRDWTAAIATAQRLQAVQGRSMAARIAQYHCEQADTARHQGDEATAQREARKALDIDHACVRASFLLAGLAEARKDWADAIQHWWRGAEQDARYLPEAIVPIQRASAELGDRTGYGQVLADADQQFPDTGAIVRARARHLFELGEDARMYLARQFVSQPSAETLLLWLEIAAESQRDGAEVAAALGKRLASRPRYTCRSCGLGPSVLFWQCPSCKQWGTVVPSADSL